MKKTKIILCGIFVLLIVLNNRMIYYQKEIPEKDEIDVKMSLLWTRSTPVLIDGNWSVIESEPWCSGSGTSNDPYIISHLTIDLNFAEIYKSNPCFYIRNSDKYFIITQCEILHAGCQTIDQYGETHTYHGYGIRLYQAEFGIISFCEFVQPYSTGVHLEQGNNILVVNNTFTNCAHGLVIWDSAYCNITGNVFTDNWYCIYERDNTEVLFENNKCIGEKSSEGKDIPGYNPFLIIGVLCGVSFILMKKKLKH